MYVHSAFRTDLEDGLAMLRGRGFGAFVVADADGLPHAVHVPFLVERHGDGLRAEFHVARANPIHALIGPEGRPALLACTGPDAYVSPDWYGVPDQVPTWAYTAVHLSGRARLLPAGGNRTHVDRLSAAFEERLLPKRPWTSGKMTPARIEAMAQAVVGIELAATAAGVQAQRKLIQHKGKAEHRNAIAGLTARGDAGSLEVARLMQGVLDATWCGGPDGYG